jgi:hypothetical protein
MATQAYHERLLKIDPTNQGQLITILRQQF